MDKFQSALIGMLIRASQKQIETNPKGFLKCFLEDDSKFALAHLSALAHPQLSMFEKGWETAPPEIREGVANFIKHCLEANPLSFEEFTWIAYEGNLPTMPEKEGRCPKCGGSTAGLNFTCHCGKRMNPLGQEGFPDPTENPETEEKSQG